VVPDCFLNQGHCGSGAMLQGQSRRTRGYFLVQSADDEEPEPAAFAFFACRFSLRDLLAAVFELFEPPLSLLAMVTPYERRGQMLTVSP